IRIETEPDAALHSKRSVVASAMPVQKVALEKRSLVLRPAQHRLKPFNLRHHATEMRPVAKVAPVRARASRQVAAAADVDDAAGGVAKDVDAGLMGQQPEGPFDGRSRLRNAG